MTKQTDRPTSSRKDTMCEMLWQLRCHGIRPTSARLMDCQLRSSERSWIFSLFKPGGCLLIAAIYRRGASRRGGTKRFLCIQFLLHHFFHYHSSSCLQHFISTPAYLPLHSGSKLEASHDTHGQWVQLPHPTKISNQR